MSKDTTIDIQIIEKEIENAIDEKDLYRKKIIKMYEDGKVTYFNVWFTNTTGPIEFIPSFNVIPFMEVSPKIEPDSLHIDEGKKIIFSLEFSLILRIKGLIFKQS